MANKKKSMLQIRRIIQLLSDGCTIRAIRRITGIHRLTISQYSERIKEAGIDFSILLSYSDAELSEIIHNPKAEIVHDSRRLWLEDKLQYYLKELQRPYLTRQLLWEEYRKEQPQGYSYSQFCDIIQRHKKRTETSLHITHIPGERGEFDFAGKSLYYFDPVKNIQVECPVLVCTLPCTGISYVEPLESARLVHLIPALNRAVQYLGGVPWFVVTDNMAQIVIQASRYEPTFTELAEQWSVHYHTAMKATRVRRPKDKPSVEKSVHLSYQRIYAQMRNET